MSDLISRQAVIDLLKQMRKDGDMVPWEGKDVFARIRKLPSAQPSGPDNLVKDSQGLAKDLVNDTISRQAAIEAIKEDKIDLTNTNVVAVFKATGDFEKVETQVMTCDRHIEILKDLPSAQPKSYREGYQAGFKDAQSERKRGRWIYGEDNLGTGRDGWFCSKCGHFEMWDYSADMKSAELNLPNYCPNCGADMREVDE